MSKKNVHLIKAGSLKYGTSLLRKKYHILCDIDELEELAEGCEVAMNNGYVPSGGIIMKGGFFQVIIKK